MPDRIWDDNPELHAEAEAQRKRHRQSITENNHWRELELIRFADMQPQLDLRPLVKGLLGREQISVVYGEAGCGKTFLVLDLGLRIAACRDWFGNKVEQGAVVYVAAEAGRGIVNRVAAWRMKHGVDGQDIPFAVIPTSLDLCHPTSGDVDKLIDKVRSAELDPILLVIDTVSRALAGGNENGPDDMGAFMRSIDRLRDELHCHVLLVHHCGKEQSKGARGHSLLRCAVDTEIEVVRDQATGIATARVTKQRDGATDGQIAFHLVSVRLGRDPDGDPVTSCVIEPIDELPPNDRTANAKLSSTEKRALDLLGEAIAKAGEIPLPCDHIPANTYCVTESLWREYCYAGQISGSDKPDARQKAFKRAAERLVSSGYVGKWGACVWIT